MELAKLQTMTELELVMLAATRIMGRAQEPDTTWNPLESEADAWMLIDKLCAAGWMITVQQMPHATEAVFGSEGTARTRTGCMCTARWFGDGQRELCCVFDNRRLWAIVLTALQTQE